MSNGSFILVLSAMIPAVCFIGVLFFVVLRRRASDSNLFESLFAELDTRKEAYVRAQEIMSRMVPLDLVKEKVLALQTYKEASRVEKGRVTITQAELETVDARLRELEEIEREIEASAHEAKEEARILTKKEKELSNKNEQLKEKITSSVEQIEVLMKEVQMTEEMSKQIDDMKRELLSTEKRIEELFGEIERGNKQYFVLKHRYDALDIEYAQLYERFTEAEAALSGTEQNT